MDHIYLTSNYVGLISLIIFISAYCVVMIEEFTHLRKSKPVIISAALIWGIIALYSSTQSHSMSYDIEKALASVFGDELMASINEKHSTYWKNLSSNNNKINFPPEIIPFSNIIKAPDNLKKRLSYIGLVKNKENIDQLQSSLLDGQILVSELGEVWRWDGFTSKGKQTKSIKIVMEQLQNRRIKQLSSEELSWKNIMDTAHKRIDELIKRQENLKVDLIKMQQKCTEIN